MDPTDYGIALATAIFVLGAAFKKIRGEAAAKSTKLAKRSEPDDSVPPPRGAKPRGAYVSAESIEGRISDASRFAKLEALAEQTHSLVEKLDAKLDRIEEMARLHELSDVHRFSQLEKEIAAAYAAALGRTKVR